MAASVGAAVAVAPPDGVPADDEVPDDRTPDETNDTAEDRTDDQDERVDDDDEATDRVTDTDTPLPFAFDVPAVMSQEEEVFDRNDQTRVVYTQQWKVPNPGAGRDTPNHSVDLQVE